MPDCALGTVLAKDCMPVCCVCVRARARVCMCARARAFKQAVQIAVCAILASDCMSARVFFDGPDYGWGGVRART